MSTSLSGLAPLRLVGCFAPSSCWFSWAEGVGGCLWALDEAGGLLVLMGYGWWGLPMDGG